ncbi:MAG TPA: hypothetical protein PKH97_16030 [Tetrasphaera sp.]|uniref:hypothetical protein n=1 Tax=Nostocoides sp. TaxID=1917966 RepID=UPI002BB8C1C3|nr:hypothetical protein [Tetrasphaera sp.]HNQ08674.1 hypothetical protein [Tetrasphaera sp.]
MTRPPVVKLVATAYVTKARGRLPPVAAAIHPRPGRGGGSEWVAADVGGRAGVVDEPGAAAVPG